MEIIDHWWLWGVVITHYCGQTACRGGLVMCHRWIGLWAIDNLPGFYLYKWLCCYILWQFSWEGDKTGRGRSRRIRRFVASVDSGRVASSTRQRRWQSTHNASVEDPSAGRGLCSWSALEPDGSSEKWDTRRLQRAATGHWTVWRCRTFIQYHGQRAKQFHSVLGYCLSGEPGHVGEYYTYRGNVSDFSKNQGIVREKISSGKIVPPRRKLA